MTPKQIIEHFEGSIPFAAYSLGFSDAAIRKWLKTQRVPKKTQRLIEAITNGKLTADKNP